MKPVAFDFRAVHDIDEALALLTEYGDEARLLAGGQSLIPLLNFRLAQPSMLIDINGLGELGGVKRRDGNLVLGAMTRESMLERSPLICSDWPLLTEAAGFVGHTAIRNRGTVGGSAAHADPAGELPATFTALDARFHARSKRGARTISADEFFVGPLTSALADDELLVEIELPPLPARSATAFVEFARKHGDFAMAGAAVCLTVDGNGLCERAVIVLLAASDVPLRCRRAERALIGTQIDPGVAREAGATAAGESDPQEPADYRRALADTCVQRALLLAWKRLSV